MPAVLSFLQSSIALPQTHTHAHIHTDANTCMTHTCTVCTNIQYIQTYAGFFVVFSALFDTVRVTGEAGAERGEDMHETVALVLRP